MREMKYSGIAWIGEIPKEWEVKKGKVVFYQSKDRGNEHSVLLAATQKYGMYPQNLLEGVVQVKEDTDLQTFKTVHVNDYVISLRSFQGGFEMSQYEGVCSPAYTVLRARGIICNNYYRYLFKTIPFIDRINSFYQGIREGKSIHFEEFAQMDIPLPSLSDQRLIANFLDEKCGEIDELVALQEKMIDELKAYKQSVITETVTKGLDKNVKMKDSGVDWIGEIPEHWNVVQLKRLAYIGNGREITKEVSADNVEAIPVYGSGGIFKYTDNALYDGESVLFGRKGTLGKPIYVNGSFWTVDTMYYLTFNKDILPRYNFYQLIVFDWNPHITHTAIPSMVGSDVIACHFPFPPLSEQQQIATYLDEKCSEIDSLISIKQKKIEELKDYKKSLIYEYVTGKKQVE